jgi:hypothetical protein
VTISTVTSSPVMMSASSRRLEHGGHRDPAALPERQVVRRPVGVLGHPDPLERLEDPRVELGAAQAGVGRAEGDVVADRRHEQLVVRVLEDEPDPPPHLGQVRPRDVQPADPDRPGPGAAGGRAEDPVEVQHQRRLAGAVGAEQRHPLPRLDPQVDPEQRLPPVGVGEGQALDVDRGGHVALQARAASRAPASGSAAATAHCPALAPEVSSSSERPVQPRASIAWCTRSPRS